MNHRISSIHSKWERLSSVMIGTEENRNVEENCTDSRMEKVIRGFGKKAECGL